jgi:hypothetical protein
VFVLVVASTLPVVIPFLVVHDAPPGPPPLQRGSGGDAVPLRLRDGTLDAVPPLGTGLGMVVLGSLLVAMTMALGG